MGIHHEYHDEWWCSGMLGEENVGYEGDEVDQPCPRMKK